MKISYSILALSVAGFLGSTALGDNGPFNLAVIQDGHGGSHFLYYQAGADPTTSVALSTDSGGVGAGGPLSAMTGTPPPNSDTMRFVIGTNQHGNANAAYITPSSNFGPARQ